MQKLAAVIEPAADAPAQTFRARLELTRSEGLPKEFKNQGATLAFQAPDRLSLSASVKDRKMALGRDGRELWMYVGEKSWGVVGKPGEPRFLSAPEKKDNTKLGALKLPVPKEQLAFLPLFFNVTNGTAETIDNVRCQMLTASPKPEAIEALKLPKGTLKLWVRETDQLPARLGWSDGKGTDVEVTLHDL